MKKITSLIIAMIMVLSAATASASSLDFLYKSYNNYSVDQTLSVKLKSGNDVVNLLDELEVLDDVNTVFDIKKFLESLLSAEYKMKGEYDISDDFKTLKMGAQIETDSTIEPNRNLKIDINSKMGLWYDLDLNEEKFELIYSTPAMNKYAYFDIADLLPDEGRDMIFDMFRVLCSKPVMDQLQTFSKDTVEKYADIKGSRNQYTIKIDNKALTSIIDEIFAYSSELAKVLNPEEEIVEIPSFAGLKLLGEKGITIKCSAMGGKPSKTELTADICLDISNLYTHFTGRTWEYETNGIIELEVKSSGKLSKYGKTKVDFPELTKENSFNIIDEIKDLLPVTDPEPYKPSYPNRWVYCYGNKIYEIDGELYVPLRATFEDAYEVSVDIKYDEGVITLDSLYFPEFGIMQLEVDSTTAYLDGNAVEIDKVLEFNDIAYVSVDMFEEIFGWELNSASYNLLEDTFDYSFRTYKITY